MPLTTALIADDEPLLREHLQDALARLWPELSIVAQARNGREAVEAFERERPDIVFLDVHMPGLSGIAAARAIGRQARLVFVTAHEQYAVEAFEQGAIDYVVKPIVEERLRDTVGRLRERLLLQGAAEAAAALPGAGNADLEAVLDALAARIAQKPAVGVASQPPTVQPGLQWIKASVGNAVRLIAVDRIVYLRSDEKYTLVVWDGGEALIRKPIRELVDELDPQRFVQVHRSVIVNLNHVAQVVRGENETADLHLRGRSEILPVSRSYLHWFRQM
jgi:DNA-binding LytR/AlgR family response regulator